MFETSRNLQAHFPPDPNGYWVSDAAVLGGVILSDPARLPHLLNSLPGIVFIGQISQAGTCTYTYFSQGCLAITGYSATELLANRGEQFSQIWHPDDLSQILPALATSAPELEYRIFNRQGELRWLKQVVTSVTSGGDANPTQGSATPVRQIQGFITDITDFKQATLALWQSENKWQSLIQQSSDLITILAADGEVLYESPAALQRLLGYEMHEKLGRSCFELIHPEDDQRALEAFVQVLAQPETQVTFEFRYRHKNGSWRYLEATATNFLDHAQIAGIVVNTRDISDFKRAERTYQSMFEYAQEGIFQTSLEGQFLSANPSLAKIYGYDSPAELQAAITNIAEQIYVEPDTRQTLVDLMLAQGMVNQFESQVYRRDGSIIWITENSRAVLDEDGQLVCFEGSVEDITERKQAEEMIRYQAFHDLLTGLPNRMLFDDRLAQALAHAHRHREQLDVSFAVMFLDIDRFKSINDTYGHEVGDKLLQHVAQRLQGCLREMDTVCRRGGDEFTLLISQLTSQQQGIQIANRIFQAFESEFMIEEHHLQVACSLGVAFYPQDGEDASTLLRHADDALYQAKKAGRNRYQCYAPSDNPSDA
jgi:diguanylate cyclase (GGDEF)-like protein/PAS domain S-box-containing protein